MLNLFVGLEHTLLKLMSNLNDYEDEHKHVEDKESRAKNLKQELIEDTVWLFKFAKRRVRSRKPEHLKDKVRWGRIQIDAAKVLLSVRDLESVNNTQKEFNELSLEEQLTLVSRGKVKLKD